MQGNLNFYCIKLINIKMNTRGYVMETKAGISIALPFHANCKKFDTYQAAQEFIREHKLENGYAKAYIRDLQDLKNEGFVTEVKDKELWTIKLINGQKIFFDPKKEEYFFADIESGYCCWLSEQQCKDFAVAYDLIKEGVVYERIITEKK